jgi:hypothetical protein
VSNGHEGLQIALSTCPANVVDVRVRSAFCHGFLTDELDVLRHVCPTLKVLHRPPIRGKHLQDLTRAQSSNGLSCFDERHWTIQTSCIELHICWLIGHAIPLPVLARLANPEPGLESRHLSERATELPSQWPLSEQIPTGRR